MPPNKQNRKQRARGKNATNSTRERTVLTLAEDPASSSSYLLPTQSAFSPALGSMFAQIQAHGSQQSGVSIPEMNGYQYQQQSSMIHPFNQLQSSPFYKQMQPFPRGQNQSQNVSTGDGLSDLEKLRQLKSTILAGQHPFFQAVPNPDALAKVYLGPHPASQAYQQQQNQNQSTQSAQRPGSPSKPQPENDGPTQKPDTIQDNAQGPQSPDSSGPSRTLVPLATPQPSASAPSGVSLQPANGATDSDKDRPHLSVTIAPKDVDYGTTSPIPLLPSGLKSSTTPTSQHLQQGPQSGVSGISSEQAAAPGTALLSPGEDTGADRPKELKEDASYREAHPDTLPYARERDRDRERSGYPEHDVLRYSQASDRRFTPRYPESRFDRDRGWDRGRDGERERNRDREYEREREREREWENDKDRRRVDDKPLDERRIEYDRSSRPPVDRRPLQSQPVEQMPPAPSEQRAVSGQLSESRLSVPPEDRSVHPHPEQVPHRPEPPVARPGLLPSPSSAEQRRLDASGAPSLYPNQSAHERDHFRFVPAASRPPAGQGTVVTQSQSQPPPTSQSLRSEPRFVPAATSVDESRSVPPDQRAPSGNTFSRPGPPASSNATSRPGPPAVSRPGPPTETNRRPDSSTGRPPASIPSPADNSAPRDRVIRPRDPPRAPAVSDSRAGHDDRETSRPFYPHPPAPPPPPSRTISNPPSPGARRPGEPSYGDREREHERVVPPPAYREPPPNVTAPRGFAEDLRRQSLETGSSRRPSDYYPSTPPVPSSPVIDRQWRERESYPPSSYPESDGRVRRFTNGRWVDVDPYARERDVRTGDVDVHPRGRPPPPHTPASWDRERPVDKEKERDRYDGWNGPERKYPSPDPNVLPPSAPRWEDAVPPPHMHRPPLQARLTDTYDERFIPADRARYPPPPPSAGDDLPMRDSFRENPRVRPRSPSPPGRGFDGPHRPKRPREEYEAVPRPSSYYDDTPPRPLSEYGSRVPPQSYYDPRAPALREPSPYSRDRAPDPYPRRDMPPPRSPPFYPRERYPR